MSILNPEITAFLTDIGYLVKLLQACTKQALSKFEPKKTWNISNFKSWGLTLVGYK